MSAFITSQYCKKPSHKVRDCKRKLEREYKMKKSEKVNHEREKKWCKYHKTNCHSDKQCFQQMKKQEVFLNGRQKKWCSLHNSTTRSNQERFQQKSGSKCKDSSTVDGRNSEEHETYVVDSTTVDCRSCCCNGKIAKKPNESEVEYSPPPGIGFNFACCYPPLFHKADGFQMLVDSGSKNISLIRS